MALRSEDPTTLELLRRPEFLYSAALFFAALFSLSLAVERSATATLELHTGAAIFFLFYGLLTITSGYQHPRIGHVSFDRVSQVASLLVLGPVEAALVNGLASLIYPWHRLWKGHSVAQVVTASLNNAGLMTLMILGCGLVYEKLGGQVPLTTLDWTAALLLPLLILSMQVVNEIGMGLHLLLRDGHWERHLNRFVLGLESGAGMAAVMVAIIFNRMELPVIVLMLAVITTVMAVVTQFARMRLELETIIADRTRVLREKTVELEQLAIRDQLTGLFNRRYADQYLDGRIEEFIRYGRRFAVALIDLDHFKRINDTYGHLQGDSILREMALRVTRMTRKSDVVARYGGEEFTVILTQTGLEGAKCEAERLHRELSSLPYQGMPEGQAVTVSIGVAALDPDTMMDSEALLRTADSALYTAKHQGKNRVVVGPVEGEGS